MVLTLYLIRHGEVEDALENRYKGSIDLPLSQRGAEQVKRVSLFIKDSLRSSNPIHKNWVRTLKAIYTSPLIRALRSAEIIAMDNSLKPVVVPELRERNFGAWEGMSFDEIRERYPKEFSLWANDPLSFSPINGESTLEVKERVMKAFDEILGRHNRESISVVAHGGVNRVILCTLMGMPLENIFSIEQDYGCVNIIEFHDGMPVVKLLNGMVYE